MFFSFSRNVDIKKKFFKKNFKEEEFKGCTMKHLLDVYVYVCGRVFLKKDNV